MRRRGFGGLWGTDLSPAHEMLLRTVVAIGAVTALAFVLVPLAEKVLGIEKPLRKNGRRRRNKRSLRSNTSFQGSGGGFLDIPTKPYFRVVVITENGGYFGRVVAVASGRVAFETMRESSPFVAKKAADAKAKKMTKLVDAAVAQARAERAGPHRVTASGRVLRLVSPAKKAKKARPKRA